jgi:hypothetical protein
MRYAFLFYETPEEIGRRASAEDAPDYWASWTRYMEMLRTEGALQGGNALEPSASATVVRQSGGETVIEDGPFADAREELGGFTIIEAANIDVAIRLAGAAPCADAGKGRVEVRPVWGASDDSAAA